MPEPDGSSVPITVAVSLIAQDLVGKPLAVILTLAVASVLPTAVPLGTE
jgi:hypothetical protein